MGLLVDGDPSKVTEKVLSTRTWTQLTLLPDVYRDLFRDREESSI
jgi:hypothetical protein